MAEDPAIYCPLCGNRVPPGLSKCPICATSLQSVIEKRAPARSGFDALQVDDYLHKELPRVDMPEAKHACPFCAMALQGGEAKCPRCGIPLVSESEMLECPECGALAPQSAKACPSCGVGFEEESEVRGPPPIEEIPPSPTPERHLPPTRPAEPAPEVVTTVPVGIPASVGEGLVNGRGAINGTGLVNGRGAVNGTGLVNGTGMTNGTRIEGQLTPGRRGRLQVMRRWQFFAVLIALAIIIPTFIYLSYSQETSAVTVDGKFGEWAHIDKYGMYVTGGSAQITVDQWAVKTDGTKLYLYVKTQGELMASSSVNSLYLFVDSDSSNATGYRVSGIGADYLLELDGWNRSVQSSSASQYPQSSTDQYNWSAWVKVGSLISEVSGNQIEAMADLPGAPSPNARFLLFTQDNIGSSVSYPAPEKGGLLVVKQEKGSGIDSAGIIAQSASVSILNLTLSCEGRSGTVESITPMVPGASQVPTFTDISLIVGQKLVLQVAVDTSSLASESSVTAWQTSSRITSTFTDVVIVGEPAKAYVAAIPTTIQIDGAFGDWAGRTSADVDSIPIGNDNVDMNAVGAVNDTDSSYFYVSVVGQMCGGSYVPMIVTKPSGGGGGGGGIFIPTKKTGEDVLRIYIDSDLSQTSGYLISTASKTIGADYMVEVKGLDGEIRSKSLMSYGSGRWNAVAGSVLDAANDVHQLELGILAAQISGSSSWDYVVETTDWSGRQDLASSVPVGTRGWPVQSGLSLQGLDATSYPGQRKIFYDGTNQWSFYFDGSDTVCRYSTNNGQTWNTPTTGGSPFIGVPGGVIFASIWYDSASHMVYVVGDKSSVSKDILVINGTVNPGTHTIAWLTGGAVTVAVSATNLGSKYSSICRDVSGYLWVLASNKTGAGATYDLSVFRSVNTGDVSLWTLSGNMIPGGDTRSGVKGSIVPAGTGSQVWAVYTYGGNVAARKFTASWSSPFVIQTNSGTLDGPMLLAPPSVVVDSRRVVHVVYGNCFENVTAKPHVMYAHNITGSNSFTSGLDLDASIPGDVGDVSPTISIDSATGNGFVFWIRTDAADVGTTIMGKKNSSGTWTSQTFASDTTSAKRDLTSIYSSPGETYISWQWTQNVTKNFIEVQFETKIPELPSVVMPVMFIVGVVMYVSRRKLRRKA